MARKPRENYEDGIYHVFARGNDRQEIFADDTDRLVYLRLLGSVTEAMNWTCLSYCLMRNHVHLLLGTPDANLSNGMQRLHGCYAQAFNARHDRVGHVFQGRYGAKLIATDAQLLATAAYIARNPVAAGLCRRPEDWRWGSYGATVEGPGPSWLNVASLLEHFGLDAAAGARQLRLLATAGGDPSQT